MDDGNTAEVVNVDFAKAFDSVDHRFLLVKPESFGLRKKFVRWIRSYLTGRTYNVQVADALSQETRVKSGVLIVNDLLSIVNVKTLLFADNLNIGSPRSQSYPLQ